MKYFLIMVSLFSTSLLHSMQGRTVGGIYFLTLASTLSRKNVQNVRVQQADAAQLKKLVVVAPVKVEKMQKLLPPKK